MNPITNLIPIFYAILLITVSYTFQSRLIISNFKKYQSVSHFYRLKKFRNSFYYDLITTGFLQILFITSLTFELTDLFEMGRSLFIIGACGSILLGTYSMHEQRFLHNVGANLYFWGLALGAFFISISTEIPEILKVFLIFIILIWILVIIFQLRKRNGIYAIETAHVLLSYAWIMAIAFTNLFSHS